jgi:hypothetical protein
MPGADVWMAAAPIIRMFAAGDSGGGQNRMRWFRVFYGLGRLRPGVSIAPHAS